MASPEPSSSLSSLSDYPEDDLGADIQDEAKMLEDVKTAYASGKPWFKKETIEKAAKAIAENADSVELEDVNGKLQRHEVKYSFGSTKPMMPFIYYNSYESLTNPAPYECIEKASAVNIYWREPMPPPECTIGDMKAALARHTDAWKRHSSASHDRLVQAITSARAQLARCKVVCLGLGSPSHMLRAGSSSSSGGDADTGVATAESRCYTQHAVVLEIVRTMIAGPVAESGPAAVLVQDPTYTDLDVLFLAQLGFTVVDDPAAFLALDDHTFVISVACNVPQKQIVADLARPVAVMWNEVEGEDKESQKGWETRPDGSYFA